MPRSNPYIKLAFASSVAGLIASPIIHLPLLGVAALGGIMCLSAEAIEQPQRGKIKRSAYVQASIASKKND